MIFKDQYDASLWHKSVFSICLLVTILVTLWLMFADMPHSDTWLKQYQITGNVLRRALIASCLIIYFLRLQVTVWVFQKRKWTWTETGIISIVMPLALYAFAKVGGNNHQTVDAIEVIGMLLYILGSYINTISEYNRHVWKAKIENKGRLYTGGFFRYSMHINYFGDIILFTGFSMITHKLIMIVIPSIMTMNFVLNIIPSLERYLEKKYKDEFRTYSKKTKKLIPWIY